jgi:hypothetical protein
VCTYVHIHLYIHTYTNDMNTCAFVVVYMQKIVHDEPRCVYIYTHAFMHTYTNDMNTCAFVVVYMQKFVYNDVRKLKDDAPVLNFVIDYRCAHTHIHACTKIRK